MKGYCISKAEKKRFSWLYDQLLADDGTLFFAGNLLQRAAQKYPDNIAVLCGQEQISYQELYVRACKVTQALYAMNIGPQDRVLIWYENSLDFYAIYHGIWQTGAVVVPLNIFLHPHEVRNILIDAQPRALIVSSILHQKLDAAHIECVSFLLDQEWLHGVLAGELVDSVSIPYKKADDVAVILYTSGTTGSPKGVMLSSKNILTNSIQGIARFDVSCQDRVYVPMPLFHSLAQNVGVWAPLIIGASVIIIPQLERKAFVQGLALWPTVIIAVPSLYGIFCLMRTLSFAHVRYFVSGGDVLPNKIRTAFALIYGRKICSGYGLTEASPLLTLQVQDELVHTDGIGLPVCGVQYAIKDGQLWVKGDNVMLGYYNAPQATHEVLQDGWLNTGDLACVDQEDRLRIVGRAKDLIIRNGLNIYPQEIENILMSHPQVTQAAVIGIKDAQEADEMIVAYVVCKQSDIVNVADLSKWVRAFVATYKVPQIFVMKDEMPITALGKIDKKKLRQEYV